MGEEVREGTAEKGPPPGSARSEGGRHHELDEDRRKIDWLRDVVEDQKVAYRALTTERDWLKVTRTAPGATRMHFWLAYSRDAQGRYVASYPGIIRVDGDPRQGLPTEDFVLRSWTDNTPGQPRAFRYPRVIEAYSRAPGRQAVRFLKADVNDIKINVQIPEARFRPAMGR